MLLNICVCLVCVLICGFCLCFYACVCMLLCVPLVYVYLCVCFLSVCLCVHAHFPLCFHDRCTSGATRSIEQTANVCLNPTIPNAAAVRPPVQIPPGTDSLWSKYCTNLSADACQNLLQHFCYKHFFKNPIALSCIVKILHCVHVHSSSLLHPSV